MRPDHRGDRRADGLEARPLHEDRLGDRAARHRRQQHLGAEHHQALRGAAGSDPAALLRHPLLQPAALHGAGRADRHADHRARDPRCARGLRHDGSRQGRRAGQGHAQLHRQPRRHGRHAGDDEGGRDLRPHLRRRRRSHRQEARTGQLGHLPHRRRGRSRHDGARHQDAAGQPRAGQGQRSVLRELRDAAGAAEAARRRRARPEDRRRLLQEGRQGHPALRSGDRHVRGRLRQGRRDRRPHPEEATGRAIEAAARFEESAGAVPLGDPARQLPLRCRAPRRRGRERARHRLRDALGLRRQPGPRSSCGSRPAGRRWPTGSRKTSMPARP